MYKRLWILPVSMALFLLNGCGETETGTDADEVKSAENIVVTENAVKTLKKSDDSKENSGQFYYSYNKEKGESTYDAETSKIRTELDAYKDIRSPYERVQMTLLINELSPDYRLLCSACHDDYANGVVGPALLDKNATYIFHRIIEFKTGEKSNPLMKQLVNNIDEKRLKAIAKEIERFNIQIKELRSKK